MSRSERAEQCRPAHKLHISYTKGIPRDKEIEGEPQHIEQRRQTKEPRLHSRICKTYDGRTAHIRPCLIEDLFDNIPLRRCTKTLRSHTNSNYHDRHTVLQRGERKKMVCSPTIFISYIPRRRDMIAALHNLALAAMHCNVSTRHTPREPCGSCHQS